MKQIVRYIFVFIFSFMLLAGTTPCALAQKKQATTTKTNTTSKSSTAKKTTTSQAKKPAATTAKKPAANTTKKTTPDTAKKPTAQPSKKPAQTTAKKGATTKQSQAKTTKGKQTSGKKSGTKMSRQAYEKQQRDLKRQIKDTENLISTNNQSVRSQNRDIQIREDEIRKRQALINSKQQEILTIKAEEDSLLREIRMLEKVHSATKKKYAAAMQHLYKWRSGYNELFFILSADDLFEGMRRVRYLRRYSEWRKDQAQLLEQQRVATQEAKAQLEQTRADHESKVRDIDRERTSLAKKQQEQQAQVADLQKRNKELQSELERDRKQVAEVEKTIQRMIEEEIRRAEEARKKAEEAERRRKEEERRRAEKQRQQGSGTSGGNKTGGTSSSSSRNSGSSSSASSGSSSGRTYSPGIDENYRRLSGSFSSNRGRLPYPVDANFAFVGHYNPSGGNSSIVLSTRVGAHACAIYEGVVTYVYSSNEEWTVIVQHGDYRSVYMNLSNVSVRKGQKVSTRQQLGTLKTEPDGNRAEIRFWIYQNSAAVNPERWLKR